MENCSLTTFSIFLLLFDSKILAWLSIIILVIVKCVTYFQSNEKKVASRRIWKKKTSQACWLWHHRLWQSKHSRNLRLWNGKKSLQGTWHHYTRLLDKGITEISKKLNSHGGFLRAELARAKKKLLDGPDWPCYLGGSSKSHCGNSISLIFL